MFLLGKQWILKILWTHQVYLHRHAGAWFFWMGKPEEDGDSQEDEGMSKIVLEIEIVKYIAWVWAVYFAYLNYKNNALIRNGKESLFLSKR